MVREGQKKRNNSRKSYKPQSEFEQRIVDLARVTRVMAGGKRLRFRACVAIGDRKGRVGWAVAKGADVAIAVNKGVNKAKKNLIKIRLIKGTIPHKVEAKFKAAKIMLKPAVEGTGIIAGGAVRQVLELAGVPNIYGKILGGTNNKISNIQATFKALESLKYSAEEEIKEENNKTVKADKPQEESSSAKALEDKEKLEPTAKPEADNDKIKE